MFGIPVFGSFAKLSQNVRLRTLAVLMQVMLSLSCMLKSMGRVSCVSLLRCSCIVLSESMSRRLMESFCTVWQLSQIDALARP